MKTVLLVAIPFGVVAAVALSWQRLFPVLPEKPAARGIKTQNSPPASADSQTANPTYVAHTVLIDAQGLEQPWMTAEPEEHSHPYASNSWCS